MSIEYDDELLEQLEQYEERMNDKLEMQQQQEIETFVNQLVGFCHQEAVDAGWWSNKEGLRIERNKGELIALMHSELSECLEGVRKDQMDDKLVNRKMEEVELADVLIRILDYAGAFDLDLGGALAEKLMFNRHRDDHKPAQRFAAGGKKF